MVKFDFNAEEVNLRHDELGLKVEAGISGSLTLQKALESILETSLDFFGEKETMGIIHKRMEELGYEFNEQE